MSSFIKLSIVATLLALMVVVFGAYVRLSNAGLSCPDWPGCYGGLLVPDAPADVEAANQAYPDRPLDAPRAWKEMVHRYLAGALGVLIVALAVWSWIRRRLPGQRLALPWLLVVLVVFQALLGMWTVTLLLKPVVVTAHLLGGLMTLSLLWWLALRQSGIFHHASRANATSVLAFRPWVQLGLALLIVQLTLGGWTSTNYAALACPDFPTCQGRLLPPLDFAEALRPWRGVGPNYEGGVLDNNARVTVHMLHRLGALVTLVYLGALCCAAVARKSAPRPFRLCAGLTLVVLIAQVALGISNVLFGLPLSVAVAHNAVAALLLLCVLSMYHVCLPYARAGALDRVATPIHRSAAS